jgi:two-component system NtrC family sensor kinase
MEKYSYGKLRWKIIVTTLCFSLIPLLSLGLTIYQLFRVSYTSKIIENLRSMADSKRNAIEIYLDERVGQLNLLVSTEGFESLKNQDNLEKAFAIIQGHSDSFVDLGVIDADGQQVAYVGPYNLRGLNYKDTGWFATTMVRRKYISDVFMGYRKIPHFVVALVSRNGEREWILRATINSDIFDDIVRAAQVGRKGDAFIINRNSIFQTKPRLSGDIGERCAYSELTKVGSRTQVEEMDLNGTRAVIATTWIKNKEWLLVLRESPEEELKPVFQARFISAALFAGGILVIVLGTIFTTQSMMAKLVHAYRDKALLDDQLVQSSKMAALGKLAAGIAHEVNNPLSVIKEKAGWMKDILEKEGMTKNHGLERFEDAISKIDLHVERAKKVTHRLLGFARRMEPFYEMVDINKTLEETIGFLENDARYRNIDLQEDYSEELPRTRSDSAQLQQVFLNILNNAVDAVAKDGRVTVRTSYNTRDEEIAVAFEDTGPGIPQQDLKRVFDPFFTTKNMGEGTGLGLSISYGIMEKLGGKITVASREGQGSTFTVHLPVVKTE